VPATVVEKLVSCISSAALLSLAPPEAWAFPLREGVAELAVAELEAGVADAADAVAVDLAAGLIGVAAAGFKTVMLDEWDEIAVINMVLPPE
jgi:hypothetical protein